MKKLKKIDWTSIIIESILIVLSILFALGINSYRDKVKKENLKINTLANIKNELQNNFQNLEILIENHRDKSRKFISINKQLKPKDINGKTVLEIIFSLDDVLLKEPSLNSTAWETAKLTNAVSLMDYKLVEKISKLYNLQQNSVEKTWGIVTRFLLSREIFETDKTTVNLQILQTYISELYRQEIYLKNSISDLIKTL